VIRSFGTQSTNLNGPDPIGFCLARSVPSARDVMSTYANDGISSACGAGARIRQVVSSMISAPVTPTCRKKPRGYVPIDGSMMLSTVNLTSSDVSFSPL